MYSKIDIEDVKLKMRHRFMADFYRKSVAKSKSYTANYFKCMGYKQTQFYIATKRVDVGESVKQDKKAMGGDGS